ncbi:MAG: DUF2752 domain-containing protein [Acidobacteriota bacterium]
MTPGRQLGFLWGGAALVCAAAAPLAPALSKGLPPCPFHWLTGIPCATCGGTRALLALGRLDFGAAFSWNPLVAAAGIVFFVGGLVGLLSAISGRDVRVPRPTVALRFVIGMAVAANWAFLLAAGR